MRHWIFAATIALLIVAGCATAGRQSGYTPQGGSPRLTPTPDSPPASLRPDLGQPDDGGSGPALGSPSAQRRKRAPSTPASRYKHSAQFNVPQTASAGPGPGYVELPSPP
ncbi:MAG TPA: hypothetical protein VHB77_22610 [Planctomycetaceae bacterium]|nr:hypothetical protein [Planctomycetaceae bacterium]